MSETNNDNVIKIKKLLKLEPYCEKHDCIKVKNKFTIGDLIWESVDYYCKKCTEEEWNRQHIEKIEKIKKNTNFSKNDKK